MPIANRFSKNRRFLLYWSTQFWWKCNDDILVLIMICQISNELQASYIKIAYLMLSKDCYHRFFKQHKQHDLSNFAEISLHRLVNSFLVCLLTEQSVVSIKLWMSILYFLHNSYITRWRMDSKGSSHFDKHSQFDRILQ